MSDSGEKSSHYFSTSPSSATAGAASPPQGVTSAAAAAASPPKRSAPPPRPKSRESRAAPRSAPPPPSPKPASIKPTLFLGSASEGDGREKRRTREAEKETAAASTALPALIVRSSSGAGSRLPRSIVDQAGVASPTSSRVTRAARASESALLKAETGVVQSASPTDAEFFPPTISSRLQSTIDRLDVPIGHAHRGGADNAHRDYAGTSDANGHREASSPGPARESPKLIVEDDSEERGESSGTVSEGTLNDDRDETDSATSDDDDDADDVVFPVFFVEEPPKSLLCPLCGKVFKSPVIANCGHTFCRGCVGDFESRVCPKDLKSLAVVVENIAVKEQIGDLNIHCRYGVKPDVTSINEFALDDSGCQATMTLSTRLAHETSCPFGPVRCPNNKGCGVFLRSKLKEHLRNCKESLPCKHRHFGCSFVGSSREVDAHLSTSCAYEGVAEFLARSEERDADLRRAIERKDEEISFLRSMLGRLSEKLEQQDRGFDERIRSLESREETREKALRDARMANERLFEEISVLNSRVNDVILSRTRGSANHLHHHEFRCKGSLVGHQGPVWCLLILGDYVITGSADKTIKVWDAANQYKCVRTLEGHADAVLCLSGADDGVFSGSADCTVRHWIFRRLEQQQQQLPPSFAVSPPSPSARTTSSVSSLLSTPPRSPKLPPNPGSHSPPSTSVAQGEGEFFATDHVWEEHEEQVCVLAVCGGRLFSGSHGVVKAFDVASREFLQDLQGFRSWVRALAVAGNKLYAASTNWVSVFDVATLHPLRQQRPQDLRVRPPRLRPRRQPLRSLRRRPVPRRRQHQRRRPPDQRLFRLDPPRVESRSEVELRADAAEARRPRHLRRRCRAAHFFRRRRYHHQGLAVTATWGSFRRWEVIGLSLTASVTLIGLLLTASVTLIKENVVLCRQSFFVVIRTKCNLPAGKDRIL